MPDEDPRVIMLEIDFLNPVVPGTIPDHIDAAYYLIHSMTSNISDFTHLEAKAASHFRDYMAPTSVKQVLYLSGISNDDQLSKHLASRKSVESILQTGNYALTILRAGIIVGSGSASFEIIRDLVEKLPLMITPKWVMTKSQPISIRDVILFLIKSLLNPKCYDQTFDIGGPDVITYKDMMLQYARAKGLKRWIFTVPVMTPRLSSYWLYFVTSISYQLAVNLVDSMKVEVVCKDNKLESILGLKPLTYLEAVKESLANSA
jgi:uncharacterized protein YbjT (DUF2867 family)